MTFTVECLDLAAWCRDADKTAIRVNRVLASVAELELLQAPGLPYSIPKEFDNRPRLTGQAPLPVRSYLPGSNSA